LVRLLEGAGAFDRSEVLPLVDRFPDEFLGDVLVREGMLTEDYLQGLLVRALHIPWVALEGCSPARDIVALLPEATCREHRAVALSRVKGFLTVATTNPLDPRLGARVREHTGLEPRLLLCSSAGLQALLDAALGPPRGADEGRGDQTDPADEAPRKDDGLAEGIEAVAQGLRQAGRHSADETAGATETRDGPGGEQ
jgi:hypothetical protein